MTMNPIKITAALLAVAIGGGAALATASAAQAYPAADDSIRASSVRAVADEAAPRADGSITFRSERYHLSDRAIISTSPTTIRIADDSAISQSGGKTSLYIQLRDTLDARQPSGLRLNNGAGNPGHQL